MSRKKNISNREKSEFGELPTSLSRSIIDAIESGFGEGGTVIDSEDKRRYFEWLADGFGLIPAWKKQEGGNTNNEKR